jgi:catechol 2,3-dioxygenase-like lactoylglutathione lyase family enzyme
MPRVDAWVNHEVPPGITDRMALSDGIRLGHVNIEVTNLARARRFYDRFLPILGFRPVVPADPVWLGYRKGRVSLWITVSHPKRVTRRTPHVPTDGIEDPISDHLGFRAPSSKRVGDIETALRRRGFKPVYATAKQQVHGPAWYTSNAWRDPDKNVLEIYALTQR